MISKITTSHKKERKNLWAGVTSTLLLLTTTGCVVGSEEPPIQEEEDQPTNPTNNPSSESRSEVIASSISTATDLGPDLQIDIYALERLENDLLRLRLGVTNNSSESFNLDFGLAEEFDMLTASNVSLIDNVNQQRYISYDQSDGSCFCETMPGPLSAGSTENLWVIYPGDQGALESMTVITPLTPPFLDVPITDVPETVESSGLAEAQILDLTMISDSLDEDQTGRTESSDEVSIILSSDVLFETNSSDLSDDAHEILEQVAQEIDDANSSVVSVDGYADNSGSDSINIPLSKDRAESVESVLNDLITRQGVTFEVEGHGSADPIADNSTEEGRDRNRRVSVTFEK